MSYEVYRVEFTIAIPDPDMPSPLYHNVLFVETGPEGRGRIHHVTGDITTGMHYDSKPGRKPEESRTFFSKELLGAIIAKDYPQEMDRILRAQPPPPKQKHFNIKTMRTAQMKPDGTFYNPGEPRQAIPALRAAGVVK
ncbi:hypothetical protein BDV97DRAFT_379149 [Delphinella strobiligena]|nr:hypothetical protein BDV97DRAFT_379149 [Delphinella strobiligena]